MGHKKERLKGKRKAPKEHDGNGSEGRISISDLIPLGNLTTRAHVRRKRNEFLAENPPKLRYFDTLAGNATPNPSRVQKTHHNLVAFLIIAAWAAIFWFHAPLQGLCSSQRVDVHCSNNFVRVQRVRSTGATGRPLAPQAARSVAPLVDSIRALPPTFEPPIQAIPTLAAHKCLVVSPRALPVRFVEPPAAALPAKTACLPSNCPQRRLFWPLVFQVSARPGGKIPEQHPIWRPRKTD